MTLLEQKSGQERHGSSEKKIFKVALVGAPNAGKTTLFNRMTGLRAKTSNYPGTTIELRKTRMNLDFEDERLKVDLTDLPGLYSLESGAPEERVAIDAILGRKDPTEAPDAIMLLLDADRLERHLYLASQILELGIPIMVVLNRMDLARRHSKVIDIDALSETLKCPVVPIVAHQAKAVSVVKDKLAQLLADPDTLWQATLPLGLTSEGDCGPELRYAFAKQIFDDVVKGPEAAPDIWTQRIDKVATHPVAGLFIFAAIMYGLFYAVYTLAAYPMDYVDLSFEYISAWALAGLGALGLGGGAIESLVVDGIIGGLNGTIIFLPQICILFFGISLLEDSGYLARAATVMDRVMRVFGLPGKAFVPMLNAHACAIPAIMSTKVIESRRDRLAAILTIPMLTCGARLPVYAMIAALLFADSPLKASLLFAGSYMIGIIFTVGVAALLKLTLLKGRSDALILELPDYRMPSFRNAIMTVIERGWAFVSRAGTVILAICIALWWLCSYPGVDLSKMSAGNAQVMQIAEAELAAAESVSTQEMSEAEQQTHEELLEQLSLNIENIEAHEAIRQSYIGRAGQWVEPIFEPLGYDWRISIGVLTSFAAREVVVSTLSVIYGMGEEGAEDQGLIDQLQHAKRADGTPLFTVATALSLLVFFILAMQCLPTLAVTARVAGGWKWAFLQLGYMSILAYVAAFLTYQGTNLIMGV